MTQYAKTTVSGAEFSAGGYPFNWGGSTDGTTFTFRTIDDLWAASGPEFSDPSARPIINLYDGAGLVVPAAFFGIHSHNAPNTNPTGITLSNDGTLLDLEGVHQGWARSHDYYPNSYGSVRWHSIEQVQGTFRWDNLDRFVDYHFSAGREVMYTLGFTPAWASSGAPSTPAAKYGNDQGAFTSSNPPDDFATWDAMCTAVATRYAGRVKYYEVWNEPNAGLDWFNGTHTQYAQLLRRANQTIKAIDPAAIIAAPGLAAISSTARTWLNSMLTAADGAGTGGTGKDWLDVLTVHTYQNPNTVDWRNFAADFNALKTVMSNNGLAAKDIFFGEGGVTSQTNSAMNWETAKTRNTRLIIALAAMGFKRMGYYDLDSATYGLFRVFPTALVKAWWNQMADDLLTGKITRVNFLWDGRLAYIRDGQKLIA